MLKRDFFIPHDKLRGTRLEWLITDDTPIESTRMIRQLRVLYFSIFGHHIKAKEYILGFYF